MKGLSFCELDTLRYDDVNSTLYRNKKWVIV